MRSLNNPQKDQSTTNNKDAGISSLASHFMDMFDTSKLDTSLLKKRDFQSQNNLFQTELQKKVKTASLTAPDFQTSMLSSMLYGLNYPVNPLLGALSQDFGALAAVQNLSLLKQQQDALLSLQPLAFPNQLALSTLTAQALLEKAAKAKTDKISVKEEFVHQEEQTTSQGSPSSQLVKANTMSEGSPAINEIQVPEATGMPALVEFTKEFPEWDLASIFNYLRSGKTKEAFEKEKQFRTERKLRKQKIRQAAKEKEAGSKGKAKGKKITLSDDYKPARVGRRTQETDTKLKNEDL